MKFLAIILAAMLDVIPSGQAYLKPLQQRDSVLIADQFEYGFRLDGVEKGTEFVLPDMRTVTNDTLVLVRNWSIDTLRRSKGTVNIQGSVVIAPFEEGHYELPSIAVLRISGDNVADTLVFEPQAMDVKTMPVDTATFVLHDIKGQMRYPLTVAEILPWAAGLWALIVIAIFVVSLVITYRSRKDGDVSGSGESAYVTALRHLDKFRGTKYWVPERQKQYYSGITDTLKAYMAVRFGVDAQEMTTAELFNALKDNKDITPELFNGTRELFELADFVKFAKHVASDDENAGALPAAVRFVTSTWQTVLEEERKDVL